MRHAGLRCHRLLLVSPVSGGERILEAICDRVVLDSESKIELLVGLHALNGVRWDLLEQNMLDIPSADSDRRPL